MTAQQRAGRSRFGLLLAAGQVRYQLLVLSRNPTGVFTALVIPLMLLVTLNVSTPEAALFELHGTRYPDFLTPAMATFALLNSCYVNVITSVVLAREEGVLKQLHGTPLPLWAYVIGRMAAAAATAAAAIVVLFVVGWSFMHLRLTTERIVTMAEISAIGIASFTTLGLAVSTLVPRPDAALAVAYGTLLPVAFLSNLFFPATTAPTWLQRTADCFPLSPIAKAAEHTFARDSQGWPMTQGQLSVTLAWLLGTALITGTSFRWQPGRSPLRRRG